MKKRRIVLASFLLIAVLVMAIGFAEVVDKLFITGEAKYRPIGVVKNDVDAAIKFTDAKSTSSACTSAILDTEDVTGDTAKMKVVFNDNGEPNQTFIATAEFTVKYENPDANAHLPSVYLNVSAAATTSGTANVAPGYTVTVDHVHPEGGQAVDEMFSPGEEMTVVVTVEYNPAMNPTPGQTDNADISIVLNYNTVQEESIPDAET